MCLRRVVIMKHYARCRNLGQGNSWEECENEEKGGGSCEYTSNMAMLIYYWLIGLELVYLGFSYSI